MVDINSDFIGDAIDKAHDVWKIIEMESHFKKQAEKLLKQCSFRMAHKLRQLGIDAPETKFLADDYDSLNLFEQISLVAEQGDLHIYPGLMDLLQTMSSNEWKNLTDDEHFVLEHQDVEDEEYDGAINIQNHFVDYATNYTNKKLEEYR